jgi:hypothetical protein
VTNPIKLTDALIADIEAALNDYHGHDSLMPERCVTAIRTLRDRARAVVFDARESNCMECGGCGNVNVREVAINALREVLP